MQEIVDSNLEWTPVNTNKEYECKNRLGNDHTMYWESDRSKSTFSIFCKADGFFDFVDERRNWPTCLEDITCPDIPPEIPTNPEYVLNKDDGRVYVERYIYPLPTAPILEEFTSYHNNTMLPTNYNAKLV